MVVSHCLAEFLVCLIFANGHLAKLHDEDALRGEHTILDCIGCVIVREVLLEVHISRKLRCITLRQLHPRFQTRFCGRAQPDGMRGLDIMIREWW